MDAIAYEQANPCPVWARLRVENLNGPWVLWDIVNRFEALDFSILIGKLVATYSANQRVSKDIGAKPAETYFEMVCGLLDDVLAFSEKTQFVNTLLTASASKRHIVNSRSSLDTSTIASELRHVEMAMHKDAHEIQFVRIDSNLSQYIKEPKLFGVDVDEAFKEARSDIAAVGNCLALELNTAAIFHLMRVAEYGLRKLAKKLGVKLTDKGKPQPIDFATWDKVITASRNKIHAARLLPNGPKKVAKLERYSDASDHCLFMKDIWRNTASHTHKEYTGPEAIAALGRVRDFMLFLTKTSYGMI